MPSCAQASNFRPEVQHLKLGSAGEFTSTDEQVRELCAHVVQSQGAEFEHAIVELQVALRDRIEQLSNITVATLLQIPKPTLVIEEPARKDNSNS